MDNGIVIAAAVALAVYLFTRSADAEDDETPKPEPSPQPAPDPEVGPEDGGGGAVDVPGVVWPPPAPAPKSEEEWGPQVTIRIVPGGADPDKFFIIDEDGQIDTDPDPGTPEKPTEWPEQGQYYQVQQDDMFSRISRRAGLGGTSWRGIRDHEKNAWAKIRGQDLLPRYPAPFYKVARAPRATSNTGYPILYIPTLTEIEYPGLT